MGKKKVSISIFDKYPILNNIIDNKYERIELILRLKREIAEKEKREYDKHFDWIGANELRDLAEELKGKKYL